MAGSSFVRFLMFAWCLAKVSCLQCYECLREDNKDAEKYCALSPTSELGNNTKVNCSAVEDRCQIVKRIKGESVDFFRRGCVNKSNCTNSCSPLDKEAGVEICDLCCDKDLCNTGEGPTEEGVSCLQCYECLREDNKDAEKYCALSPTSELGNNTKVNCSAVEDRCQIVKRIKGESVDFFRRGCVNKSNCTNSCSPLDKEAGVEICDLCCDKDLCNTGEGPTEEGPTGEGPTGEGPTGEGPTGEGPTGEGPTRAPQTSGSSGIHMILGLSLVGPLLIWFL